MSFVAPYNYRQHCNLPTSGLIYRNYLLDFQYPGGLRQSNDSFFDFDDFKLTYTFYSLRLIKAKRSAFIVAASVVGIP